MSDVGAQSALANIDGCVTIPISVSRAYHLPIPFSSQKAREQIKLQADMATTIGKEVRHLRRGGRSRQYLTEKSQWLHRGSPFANCAQTGKTDQQANRLSFSRGMDSVAMLS